MKKYLLILAMLLCVNMTWGIPADPTPRRFTQPDGSTVTLRLHGDEWLHFTTTIDGYTVVKDERGYYAYAQLHEGKLISTGVAAHDADQRDKAETVKLDY